MLREGMGNLLLRRRAAFLDIKPDVFFRAGGTGKGRYYLGRYLLW